MFKEIKDFAKNHIVLTIMIIILIILPFFGGISAIISYFFTFPINLSGKQEMWGQFGDFIGGVFNPLLSFYALIAAILAIGYQMFESKKARENMNYQMFESIFFKLLEMHNKGMEFSKVIQNFNNIFYYKLKEDYLKKIPNSFDDTIIEEWLNDPKILYPNYREECIDSIKLNKNEKRLDIITKIFKKYNMTNAEEKIFADVSPGTQKKVMEKYSCEMENSIFKEILKNSCNELYEKCGNLYAHYCRNISTILEHLNSTNKEHKEKFGELFEAQLSLDEITVILIYCVSSRSNKKFRANVKEYKLLNRFHHNSLVSGNKIKAYFDKET